MKEEKDTVKNVHVGGKLCYVERSVLYMGIVDFNLMYMKSSNAMKTCSSRASFAIEKLKQHAQIQVCGAM